ncbi:hypothetical protein CEK26_009956 [Fusarium fujikuroi]|nr:hypothetical protein CEK27_009976 [Fusarium fujikuroi]QGI83244.1 hypothetical protein CEK25_009973 [Fusarium fujikuroi]QGI96887.1 hypothetical protein CEK26_009956 [Fusarium fujikuroi]
MATLYTCSSRGLTSHKFWDESEETVWSVVASIPPPSPPQVVAPMEQEPCANFSYVRVLKVVEAAREHLLGGLYGHLPHCELDWSLDDDKPRCRVVGMDCYGMSFTRPESLKRHLLRAHTKHEAQLAREWVEAPSSSPQPSPSLHQPPTPIAPALEMDFVEVGGELEAERALDTSQSAVAAESGIPIPSSKRSFAPAEIPDMGEERESAPRLPPHLRSNCAWLDDHVQGASVEEAPYAWNSCPSLYSIHCYYQTIMYEKLGINGKTNLLVAGIYNCTGPLANLFFITFISDRIGRKRPLIYGIIAITIALILESAVNSQNVDGSHRGLSIAGVAFLFCVTIIFSLSFGPVSWTYMSEVMPYQIRGKGCAFATGIGNWLVSTFWNQVSPFALEELGWKFYFLFVAFNLVITLPTLIFAFRETKGLSLEEIDLMFGDRALGNLPADIEKDGGVIAVTNTHDERPRQEL